jgi:hypothetical protein
MEYRWSSQPFTYPAGKKTKNSKIIKNHFGIYINNSSWPRLWLSAYLHSKHREKSDQTLVRSPANPAHMSNLDIDAMLFYFSSAKLQEHIDLRAVHDLLQASPMTSAKVNLNDLTDKHINTEVDYSSVYSAVADDIIDRYNHIFCDVVCETMFTGECFSLTEKMSRCFITETPFICMANKNYLSQLRSLGFKTFGDFWNEEYDYTSDALRCIQIAKVIDELALFKHEELHSLYKKLHPILIHNKKRYLELCGMQKNELEKLIVDCLSTKSQ